MVKVSLLPYMVNIGGTVEPHGNGMTQNQWLVTIILLIVGCTSRWAIIRVISNFIVILLGY